MNQSATRLNGGLLPENWGLLYAAFAFSQAIGLITYWTLPILAGALITGLELSGTQVGLIGTIEFAGLLVSSMLLAPFIDRGFRRTIALISVAIVISVNLICAAFPLEYQALAALRFVCGLGSGLALAVGNATIANARDAEKFSGHLTIALVAFMVVIMPVFTRLSEAYGHQGVFFGLAVAVAIGAVSILFLPNGPNTELAADAAQTDNRAETTDKLLTTTALLVLAVAVLFGVRDTLPWLVAEQLGANAGMSLPEMGNLFSLMYAVSILGPASLLFLSRMFGPKTLLAASMTATGLFAWMFTVSDGNAMQFSLGIIIWATIYFIAFAQLNAVAAMVDRKGRLVSAVGSSFIAGVMAGPVIGGYLLDRGGFGSIGAAELVLTALMAVIILGLRIGKSATAGPAQDNLMEQRNEES